MIYNNQRFTWMLPMPTTSLDSFIDNLLIEEYATKDSENIYSLSIDSIPIHDVANFLDTLMQSDPDFKEMVFEYMDNKIQERLIEAELRDREEKGLFLNRTNHGDYELTRRL